MAGRSLEDIMRQQAAQRQAQIQAQQAQERALQEQRERVRQEYLQRSRMYEKLSNINPSAASAVSAGGSRVSTTPTTPTTSGYTELFLITEGGNYKFFIFNYTNETITDVTDTTIPDSWSFRQIVPIQETGYMLIFRSGGSYTVLFVNDNGKIIKNLSFDSTTLSSWDVVIGSDAVLYFTTSDDVNYTCYYFDGKVVTEFTPPAGDNGVSITVINNGSVILGVDNEAGYLIYIWNVNNGLIQLGTDTSNNFVAGTSANFVLTTTLPDWSTLNAYDSITGELKSTLDLTDYNSGTAYTTGYIRLYGTNKAYGLFHGNDSAGINIPYLMVDYNGDTNTFTTTTHARGNNYKYNFFNGGSEALVNISYPNDSFSQFQSPSEALVFVFANAINPPGNSPFYIDEHSYCDIVWKVEDADYETLVISNNQPTRGLNMNDDQTGLFNGTLFNYFYQYSGKSVFLQALLGDNYLSLVELGYATHSIIKVAATASIDTGYFHQGWAAFRSGDNFGFAYGNTNGKDVIKMLSLSGNLLDTVTMSQHSANIITLNENSQGNLAIVDDTYDETEYVFNTQQSTFATYTNPGWTSVKSIEVYKTETKRGSSALVRYNSSSFRIYTDTSVSNIITPSHAVGSVAVAEDFIIIVDSNAPITIYVYDMSGTLVNTISTGDSILSDVYAVKNRGFVVTYTGSTYNYHYVTLTNTLNVSGDYTLVKYMPDDSVWYRYYLTF